MQGYKFFINRSFDTMEVSVFLYHIYADKYTYAKILEDGHLEFVEIERKEI